MCFEELQGKMEIAYLKTKVQGPKNTLKVPLILESA